MKPRGSNRARRWQPLDSRSRRDYPDIHPQLIDRNPDAVTDPPRSIPIYLVSDSTGETVQSVARACIVQFEGVEGVEHHFNLVRSEPKVRQILERVEEEPGVVFFTMVSQELRRLLMEGCRRLRVPCISVLDPFMTALENYIGVPAKHQPGRQHMMDADYFTRIEAMQFALAHDDGQGLWNLHSADVVVTGVSRTSKTPTCIYLANRGIKAANVPFVPGIGLPEEILGLVGDGAPLVVGLTKDPASLVQIRKNRLKMIAEDDETDYVDLETVRQEVIACRRICRDRDWPMIDVSRRSIEETAAAVMQHFERRRDARAPT
jgi:regulator of PEP synthase PpsR (kinase-PPPase family)